MKVKKPRDMTLCYKVDDFEINSILTLKNAPRFLFVGEIKNMPGHCVVIPQQGGAIWGYHTNSFIEIPEDEV